MKTIGEVLNSWNAGYVADNPHKVDGYNKADVLEWLARQHLLQQTQCTTQLLVEMNNIRSSAVQKKGERTNKLSEAYIEAQTCIDVIDHLLKFIQ